MSFVIACRERIEKIVFLIKDSFSTPKKPAPLHGSSNGNSKLNEQLVRYIKLRLKSNEKPCSIARSLNVNKKTIYNIRDNKTWKHVTLGDR